VVRRTVGSIYEVPSTRFAPSYSPASHHRFQERSQKTYKARDAFIALVMFEIPMGCLFGALSYLVMWAPVGWDYKSPDRLWKALLLFALASGPIRAVFSAVQLSSRSSSSARLIATFSLMEATGGIYMRYKNVRSHSQTLCELSFGGNINASA
jgi:hypothetical protein